MKLGRILRKLGFCSDRIILEALDLQRHGDTRRIGNILLDLGYINKEQLVKAIEYQNLEE